jgi:predicted nucleic acid-binding Zn ribbon protein
MTNLKFHKANDKTTARNRGFSSLQEELNRFVATQSSFSSKGLYGLLNAWEAVAQESVLAHTDNVVYSKRSKETELLIFVDDAAWAAELTMNKEIYRILMEKQLNKSIVDIKFLVSKTTAYRKNRLK